MAYSKETCINLFHQVMAVLEDSEATSNDLGQIDLAEYTFNMQGREINEVLHAIARPARTYVFETDEIETRFSSPLRPYWAGIVYKTEDQQRYIFANVTSRRVVFPIPESEEKLLTPLQREIYRPIEKSQYRDHPYLLLPAVGVAILHPHQ